MTDEIEQADGPENLTLRLLRRIDERVQRIDERVDRVESDMAVLTAIVIRQDGTLSALLTEVRAMHSQHSRLASRVRALEEHRP